MYKISDFLELYKSLERWAEAKYGEEGVKAIEENHHNKKVQNDVRYFRKVRNVLAHNPNGSSKPLIELTMSLRNDLKRYVTNSWATSLRYPFRTKISINAR